MTSDPDPDPDTGGRPGPDGGAPEDTSGPGGGGTSGDDARPTPLVLTSQIGGAVFLVLAYWVVVVLLPTSPLTGVGAGVRWAVYSGLVAVLLAALLLLLRGVPGGRTTGAATPFGAATLALYVALLDVMLLLGLTGIVVYTDPLKFALAVGGGALAAFAFGVIVFSTVRVAASLPIVVLFIGLAAFPGAAAVPPEVQEKLLLWMGVILGVSAAAEGATQATKVLGTAQVARTVAARPESDGARLRELTRSITQPAREVGGDLQTTANGNPTLGDV